MAEVRPLALIVEDEPDVAALLRDLVEEEDWDVIVANTLAEARGALTQLDRPLDLALLDQQLPDGRGLSLVSEVRRRFPEARVVAVTASTGLTRELEGKLVDALFHKPLELKRFLREVHRAEHRGDEEPGPA